MSIILEEDVLNAYISNEIDEYDVISLYQEGYISENTMQLLVNSDDYIAEAVAEIAKEMENLEEGYISRGARRIGHRLDIEKDKLKSGYHAISAMVHHVMGNKDASDKHHQKLDNTIKKMIEKRTNYLKKQRDDAEKSGHVKAASSYSRKLVKYDNYGAHEARAYASTNPSKVVHVN